MLSSAAIQKINSGFSAALMGGLTLGIITFLMLLFGNLCIKRNSSGVKRVAAGKAVFNTTLVLAIMIGLWVLFTMTDRLFAEGSAEAMTRMPF